jgi:hypothetical protein
MSRFVTKLTSKRNCKLAAALSGSLVFTEGAPKEQVLASLGFLLPPTSATRRFCVACEPRTEEQDDRTILVEYLQRVYKLMAKVEEPLLPPLGEGRSAAGARQRHVKRGK